VTGDPVQKFAAALPAKDAAVEVSPANVQEDVAAPLMGQLAAPTVLLPLTPTATNDSQAGGQFMNKMRSSLSLSTQVMDEAFADVDDCPMVEAWPGICGRGS
jgi:hypothetical protein